MISGIEPARDDGPEIVYCSMPNEGLLFSVDAPELYLIASGLYQTRVKGDNLILHEVTPPIEEIVVSVETKGSDMPFEVGPKEIGFVEGPIEIVGLKSKTRTKAGPKLPYKPKARESQDLSNDEQAEYVHTVLETIDRPGVFPYLSTEFYQVAGKSTYEYGVEIPTAVKLKNEHIQIAAMLTRMVLGNDRVSSPDLEDLRNETEDSRGSFFSSVVERRSSVEAADISVAELAHNMAHVHFLPAIREIERRRQQASLRTQLGNEYLRNPRPALEVVGAYAVAQFANTPIYAPVSGLAILTAANLTRAYWEARRGRDELEQLPEFFLHQVANAK